MNSLQTKESRMAIYVKVLLDTAEVLAKDSKIQFSNCGSGSNFDYRKSVSSLLNNVSELLLGENTMRVEVISSVTHDVPGSDLHTTMQRTGQWSQQSGMRILGSKAHPSLLFPNTYRGWRNTTVVVCSPSIIPFNYYSVKKANYSTSEVQGMLKHMLFYLENAMQFKAVVKEPDDGQWGGPVAGSDVFSGCVGELQRGIAQLAGSVFTITSVRQSKIDFLFPLFEEANGVLLKISTGGGGLWNIYRPLSPGVWLLVLGSAFVASFVMYLTSFYSPFSAWNLMVTFRIRDEIRMWEQLWNLVGSFFMQGQDFYPFAMSSRCILGMWWLFTLIIFSAYSADLVSFLTVKNESPRINSLSELAAQSAVKSYVVAGSSQLTVLSTSGDSDIRRLHSNMRITETVESCQNQVLNDPLGMSACILDHTALLYYARQNSEQVYLLPEVFHTGQVGFMVPKDSPYYDQFNRHLQKMQESGLMEKWFKDTWGRKVNTDTQEQSAESVTLGGLAGAYAITLILYGVGILILLIELIWINVFKYSVTAFPGF